MDERYYDMVLAELKTTGPRRGLLAKSFAEANGDERMAEARYLKLRASQLARDDQRVSRTARRRALAAVVSVALAIAAATGVIAQGGF